MGCMSMPMNIQGQHKSEPEPTVTVLTDEQVWELIEGTRFARLGTVDEDGYVHITPLNIVTDGVRIFFRTAAGSKVTQLLLNDRVTVQFDRVEGLHAYSVNIFGTARLLTETRELDYMNTLNLEPWLDTVKLEGVEITPVRVTGRRFLLGK